MLLRAYRICSSWSAFHEECLTLMQVFSRLEYPQSMIERSIKAVITDSLKQRSPPQTSSTEPEPIRLVLPYKSDKLSQQLRLDLRPLSRSLDSNIQPVFTSRKLQQLVTAPVQKDPLVSRSRVVYDYHCACDMHYVGFTARHLHQRVSEHQRSTSAIWTHCRASSCAFDSERFSIIAKCSSQYECQVREAIEIYFRRPALNRKEEYRCSVLYRCRY